METEMKTPLENLQDHVRELEEKIEFYQNILPWGYRDVELTMEYLKEAGCDEGRFGDYLQTYCDDAGKLPSDCDPVSHALEFIALQVKGAVELEMHVFSNYSDSQFDLGPEDAAKILSSVKEEDRNQAWAFLVRFCDAGEYITTSEEGEKE